MPTSHFAWLCALLCQIARADLPFGSVKAEKLQGTQSRISFDPLALLAVLHNLRAAASAARLYSQPFHDVYRWPHTSMIGGALAPFKLLIEHLASKRQSIHPTEELLKADTARLTLQSNIGFSDFLASYSNFWLADLLDFRPSTIPLNDLHIVQLDSIDGQRVHIGQDAEAKYILPRLRRVLLNLTDGTIMCLLLIGLIFSVLAGDMWSTSLFATYLAHCVISILASCRQMMSLRQVRGARICEDATTKFAVYQRPAGGKIVFKARKDTLESWARTSWTYRRTQTNNMIHWAWMVTGSVSATASVVCMVNMAGRLQLGFLAIFAISSAYEIAITQLVRQVQSSSLHFGASKLLSDNEYWTRSVVRSVLEVDDEWSLADLPWVELGLFPDMMIFRNLSALLPGLRAATMARDDIIQELIANSVMPSQSILVQRIANEIEDCLAARTRKTA